ncbi:restriction endonuclease subunit S [Pseudonocardia sp.]|uniref:restriction endonuclease subunit S n=1 Tax=Pseudonocardia sp. TaxID=60912 RepID=UPI003D1237AD
MIGLPSNWRWSTVAAEGSVDLGRQRHPNWHTGPEMRPYLRVANVFEDRIDTTDLKYMDFSGVFDRYKLRSGDVLLNEGQSPELLGRPAIYRGIPDDIAFTNTLIRFRAGPAATPEWALTVFRHYMHSGRFAREARITTKIAHLSASRLKAVEFPVPPLEEQRHIVGILEDHLSRIEAADGYVATGSRRALALVKSLLRTIIPDVAEYPSHWTTSTVDQAGRVELGRQRHPDWHTGPNMRPYLRVANVFEDRIDLSDVKEMHWPGETFERFRLRPGDVLLNEGQSPEFLGRPAIYRGDPPAIAFTNTLLRFTPHDGVMPEFALLVFRRHMHTGRFTREARITTNIGHLSAARLKPIEFPIPPVKEQAKIVAQAKEYLDAIQCLERELARAVARSATLRRSLLSAAFSGRLTNEQAQRPLAAGLVDA